jgi:pterin-4a-carbinolamine dehydratase
MAPSDEWRQEGETLVRDLEFDEVRLTLTTHSEGRLTDEDRAMAETIDGLV